MNKIDTSKYLNEGLIIAGFTLLSYVIAYKFECGFCEYWQLPIFLIKINLTTAIASGLSLFSFLMFLFIFINFFISIFENELSQKDSIKRRLIIYHIGAVFVLIALFMGYGISFLPIFILFLIILFDVPLIFIPWYIDKKKYPKDENIFNRIARSFEEESRSNNAFDWLSLLLGKNIILLIFVGLPILTLLASSAGIYYAKGTQNFYIVENRNLLLLKKYDDTYVLRPVDLLKNEVGNELYIWRNEEIGKEKLVKKRLTNIKMIKS